MASRFWVGGTGTWDSSTTTHWSASTGGAGGASAPTTNDTVTIDASSGAGTITADSTINGLSLTSLTCGAMGMTLDFSVNNPSMTIGTFSSNGTGTRTIHMGSGTFTINVANGTAWDFGVVTGLTFDCGTSTILFSGTQNNTRSWVSNGQTFNNVTINAQTNGGQFTFAGGGTVSIANLTINSPSNIGYQTGITVTGAFIANGSSNTSAISFLQNTVGAKTITLSGSATMNWMIIQGGTFTGSKTATNSIDLGGNSGITITGPSGSGSHMIGG